MFKASLMIAAAVVLSCVAASCRTASVSLWQGSSSNSGGSEPAFLSLLEDFSTVRTAAEFDAQIMSTTKPVLVDFYGKTCPGCVKLAPALAALEEDYEGQARFVKVPGDDVYDLVKRYNIKGYPTVMVFCGGKPVRRLRGCFPEAKYRRALNAVVADAPPWRCGVATCRGGTGDSCGCLDRGK